VKVKQAHCSLDGDYSNANPRLRVADGGRLVQLRFARSQAAEWNAEMFGSHFGGVRGACRGFSFSSRRRMMERLNSVSVAASLPAFVTLTFPDAVFDDDVSAFAKFGKSCLDAWFKRLRRVAPSACGFWRLEWQARKSGAHEGKLFPHFHLLIWGLETRRVPGNSELIEHCVPVPDSPLQFSLFSTLKSFVESSVVGPRRPSPRGGEHRRVCALVIGDWRVDGCDVSPKFANRVEAQSLVLDGRFEKQGYSSDSMSFQDWASLSWYHVVQGGDINHFTAGCRVERVKTWGGVVSYCAKYMAKADAEFLSSLPVGRSWGVFNRALVPWAKIVEMDLTEEVGVRLRRVARRYLEHRLGRRWKASYGITVFCDGAQFLRLVPPDPDPY
jgi:hypothetical protein